MSVSTNREEAALMIQGLRHQLRDLLGIGLDEYSRLVLSRIIQREPVTLYRVTRETMLNFSTIYKKASRLLVNGLIRQSQTKTRGNLYEATVKGYLVCLSAACLEDHVVLSKIKHRWGLGHFDQRALLHFLTTIVAVLRAEGNNGCFDAEDPVPLVLRIYYMCGGDVHRCLLRYGISGDVVNDASRIFAYYLIKMVAGLVGIGGLLLGDRDYVALVDSRGLVVVAQCNLCGETRYCTGETACPKLYDRIYPVLRGVRRGRV